MFNKYIGTTGQNLHNECGYIAYSMPHFIKKPKDMTLEDTCSLKIKIL